MIEKSDFDTFLYISKNEYQIFVYDKVNFKSLYNKRLKINLGVNLDDLIKFLDDNIYKIEKIVGNFIRNIILIIEDDKILSTNISLKKNNYDNYLNKKFLKNNLTEVKDIFKENYQDQVIMHMIIVNDNDSKNNFLLDDLDDNDNYLYLEVNFITIANNLTLIFDKILENYQIKVQKYMSGSYIKSFLNDNETELSVMAKKLNDGFNRNEVKFVSKNIENKGFFEKFFQLFS
tara:strand:- start:634 stop:1329 length:696 start_codon:yes stop_codon:yes gene_type:complete